MRLLSCNKQLKPFLVLIAVFFTWVSQKGDFHAGVENEEQGIVTNRYRESVEGDESDMFYH